MVVCVFRSNMSPARHPPHTHIVYQWWLRARSSNIVRTISAPSLSSPCCVLLVWAGRPAAGHAHTHTHTHTERERETQKKRGSVLLWPTPPPLHHHHHPPPPTHPPTIITHHSTMSHHHQSCCLVLSQASHPRFHFLAACSHYPPPQPTGASSVVFSICLVWLPHAEPQAIVVITTGKLVNEKVCVRFGGGSQPQVHDVSRFLLFFKCLTLLTGNLCVRIITSHPALLAGPIILFPELAVLNVR